MPTLLVLTGVSDAAELLAAPPGGAGRTTSARTSAALDLDPDDLALGPRPGWTVDGGPDGLVLAGAGDPLDALRALCVRHWDTGGGPARVRADGDDAAAALRALGLVAAAGGSGRIRWPEPTRFRAPRDADSARDRHDESATSSAASLTRADRGRWTRGPCRGPAPEEAVGAAVAGLDGSRGPPARRARRRLRAGARRPRPRTRRRGGGRRRCRHTRPGVTAVVTRARLDAELVRRGLARSREQAAELIEQGRVAVRGVPAGKPATVVDRDTPVTVRRDGRAASGPPAARTS